MAIVIITAVKEHQGTQQESRRLEEVYKHSYWSVYQESVWKKWVSIVAILYNRLTFRWFSILIKKLAAGWVWTLAFPKHCDVRNKLIFRLTCQQSQTTLKKTFSGPVCGSSRDFSALLLSFYRFSDIILLPCGFSPAPNTQSMSQRLSQTAEVWLHWSDSSQTH